MNNSSLLGRESFQQLLASAFAVQESQIDSQSLSAIVEIRRLITKGDLDVDGAMLRIVDSARNVANATGVAIALLKGDQLVYQAASGSAATYLGRRVTASLTVSAERREILRVENAQTDTRIEAAICRQFGAKSLLILPIYHNRAVAGVLELLYGEAHAFQDREVRTYRLMAELIGEAISRTAQIEEKKSRTTELPTIPRAIAQILRQAENLPNEGGPMPDPTDEDSIYQPCRAAVAGVGKQSVLRQSAVLATVIQRAKRVPWHKRRGNVALAAVASVLLLTCWIAYSGRGPGSPLGSLALKESTPIKQPAKGMSAVPPASVLVKVPKPARAPRRRVQVRENEIDYITDDVTIRYFTSKPAPQPKRAGTSQVAYIGDDVTVRYFTPKPAARPTTVRTAAQPGIPSWPEPPTSVSQKPVR
jgi:hypothetical protein